MKLGRIWVVLGLMGCAVDKTDHASTATDSGGLGPAGEDTGGLADTGLAADPHLDPDPDPDPDDDTSEPEPDPESLGIFEPSGLGDGGLTIASADLMAVLEGGSLTGACDAWRLDPEDLNLELRCGKWMFFYETFGTEGVPVGFVDLLLSDFETQVGPGFSEYGLVPDPLSSKGYPLGMVEGANGVAFTCASCHFGVLPDGRYSVGAANHSYDYGGHNLALGLFPLAAMSALMGSEVDPDAQARVQPLLDHLSSNVWLQIKLVGVVAGLIGTEIPTFTAESQHAYSQWLPGTMDFFIEPLPIDDGVHTVSKISALYGIPTVDEELDAGMAHAMLGWTGNTVSLENFVGQFDALGGGDGPNFSPESLQPLATYIRTLHAPTPLDPSDTEAVARGEEVFVDAGCLDCHRGPRGGGLELYDYEDIGTDNAMAMWMDPELDGEACCGVDFGPDAITNQLKSPRLVGLWTMERFLHNGSVGSLQELLCVGGAVRDDARPVFGNMGHTEGCDTLSDDEKADLIEFLEAH